MNHLQLLLFGGALLGSASGDTVSRALLNAGTRYETPIITIDSGVAGPTILVVAGQHGNEPAGSAAADGIAHWDLAKGKLIVIPRANVPALRSGTRYSPSANDLLKNLNRNFPRAIGRGKALGPRAQAIWDVADQERSAWILDLHEGFDFHRINPRSVGSTIIHRDKPEVTPVMEKALAAVNATISVEERRFISKTVPGPVEGGLIRAAEDRLGSHGAVLETTSKDQWLATRSRQHRLMVSAIFQELGITSSAQLNILVRPDRIPSGYQAVAILDDSARNDELRKLETALRLEDVTGSAPLLLRRVSPSDVAQGGLKGFHAFLIPNPKIWDAATMESPVKTFLSDGGGVFQVGSPSDKTILEGAKRLPTLPKTPAEVLSAL